MRGRKPRVIGERAEIVLKLRLTPSEREALGAVARENNQSIAGVVREAVNEFVEDYGERRPFARA